MTERTKPGRILVYDHTSELGERIRAATAGLDPRPEVVECGRPRALGDFLTEQRFDVLVAGPGLDTRAGWERLRIIREEVPEMALVLALDGQVEVDVRDVVRAGAVDVVDMPISASEAAAAVERALAIAHQVRPPADAAGGTVSPIEPSIPRRVITIASASGGCGKTFLATNLAWFLHRRGGRRVCILDLDLQFGEVSSALRLRPQSTIVDLLQAGGETGGDLVDVFPEHCEVHESGIAVLAAPRDPTEAQMVHPADVGRIIDAARRHFDDVIVDTPPALADTVVTAFNRSDELLVMATLDVPSVRNMHVFLGTLERLDVDGEGIRLLLNKAEADAGIETSQILKLFPQGFDATLPYAREVHRSINAGKPVLDTSPDAAISHQLEGVLRRLLPPEAQAEVDERMAQVRPPRPWRRSRRTREKETVG